jgi:hypothetical protein
MSACPQNYDGRWDGRGEKTSWWFTWRRVAIRETAWVRNSSVPVQHALASFDYKWYIAASGRESTVARTWVFLRGQALWTNHTSRLPSPPPPPGIAGQDAKQGLYSSLRPHWLPYIFTAKCTTCWLTLVVAPVMDEGLATKLHLWQLPAALAVITTISWIVIVVAD